MQQRSERDDVNSRQDFAYKRPIGSDYTDKWQMMAEKIKGHAEPDMGESGAAARKDYYKT